MPSWHLQGQLHILPLSSVLFVVFINLHLQIYQVNNILGADVQYIKVI